MTPAEFTARTEGIAYASRGMLFSELYLLARVCQEHAVTAICESGVASGVSTRVLRRLFSDVTSFDKVPVVIPEDLRDVVTIANGRDAVPAWVRSRPDGALAVLLDGPKGPRADLLRAWCFEQPQVRLVAQHDSPRGRGETVHSKDVPADALDARVPAETLALVRSGLGIWVNTA